MLDGGVEKDLEKYMTEEQGWKRLTLKVGVSSSLETTSGGFSKVGSGGAQGGETWKNIIIALGGVRFECVKCTQ